MIQNENNKIEKSHISKELKKKRISWYLYDWANSAYSTTVLTLFLGPYLTSLAKASSSSGIINFWGISIPAGSIFPYSVSISVLLQAFLLPFIGAKADKLNSKNTFLALFAILGSVATILFFVIEKDLIIYGSLLLIISNLAFGASIVIYNSLITEISSEDEREEVSSKGWAVGYIGGGLLLIINLIIFLNNDVLGISKDLSIRINLALAGLWWAMFSIPIIFNFQNKNKPSNHQTQQKGLSAFSQLKATFKDSWNYPIALLFLIAYLFYNDGVQSVISLASQFGQEELKLGLSFLTIVILAVQFVAALGAIIFMKISKRIGEKKSILSALFIWIIILIYAYALLKGAVDFFILAMFIAIVMGGTQAISRSLYSKLIPKSKEAEYFSFYEISEKGSSWIGPLVFGLVYQYSLSYRLAILSLIIFFVIGGTILLFTKINVKKTSVSVT